MADASQVDTTTAPPTGDVNLNAKQVLANAFQSGPLDSKKWLAMMIGLGCVMVLVGAGMTLVYVSDPAKAQYYASLVNIGVMFIGAMVTTLLTGQSAVEWKNSNSLAEMHTSEVKAAVETQNLNIHKDVIIDVPYTKEMDEKIKEDSDDTAAEVKPFAAAAQAN